MTGASGDRPGRRRFLRTAGAGVVALAASGCAGVVALPVPVRAGRIELTLRDHPSLTRPGGTLTVQPEGWPAPMILLTGEGGEPKAAVALSPVCTHQGCVVDVEGDRLVCPCHGSTYDREGRVVRGPAERPLRRYPVRLRGGTLVIEVNAQESNGGRSV